MPKICLPLSDKKIKESKSKDKDYKLSDGRGLYIVIKSNGTKMWRFDFTFLGKRKSMSFGIYDKVTLNEARQKREKARKNLERGINPIDSKSSNFEVTIDFKYVSEKWLALMKGSWSNSNYEKIKSNLVKNAYPFIGQRDIKNITRKDILALVERMENRNAIEYASRLLNNIQRIYKYAITNEYVERNIISDIDKQNSLKRRQKKNVPAITKKEQIRKLLKDIYHFASNFNVDKSTIYALKLAPYVALRPFNLSSLEWDEINFESKTIEISKDKMKMSIDFVLPLSNQAFELLKEIETFKSSKFVFPSTRTNTKSISGNTINIYLHKMGYKNIHTAHGFRAMFATNAYENISEHHLHSDIIESCLAHAEPNRVKAAYNRASKYKYIEEKRKLMQWWADWLDALLCKLPNRL